MPGDQLGPSVDTGGRKLSIKTVDALVARVQRLIDTRSESEDPLAWYIEASYLGDLRAIAALAVIAARSADKQLLIVRELDAPRDLVYEAWTTPALVKRWWGGHHGEVTTAEIDLRVGGRWRYVLLENDGRRLAFHGEYREIVLNERIVSTEIDEVTRGESVNTVVFTEVDGRTRLTLLMELASSEARDAAINSALEIVVQERMNLLEQVAASLR